MFSLERKTTSLLVIDVQEKLFPKIDRGEEIAFNIFKMIKGASLLNIPIVYSEQSPEKLGETIPLLKAQLEGVPLITKTSFSCLGEQGSNLLKSSQWILTGIEAHICVLQTARDLIKKGAQVVVLNDAISSRSIFDFSSAIAELRDYGARISTTETVLFELLKDAKAPEFKEISRLVQCTSCSCSCE